MKKKFDVEKLSKKERWAINQIIRAYCKEMGMYKFASTKGLGLESCEEAVRELIEVGDLIIYWEEETDLFRISPKEDK